MSAKRTRQPRNSNPSIDLLFVAWNRLAYTEDDP